MGSILYCRIKTARFDPHIEYKDGVTGLQKSKLKHHQVPTVSARPSQGESCWRGG